MFPDYVAYTALGPVDYRTHWTCPDLGCVDVGVGVIHHPHCGLTDDKIAEIDPEPPLSPEDEERLVALAIEPEHCGAVLYYGDGEPMGPCALLANHLGPCRP